MRTKQSNRRSVPAMDEAIEAFEQGVGALAMDLVRAVLQEEYDQRVAAGEARRAEAVVEPAPVEEPPEPPPPPGNKRQVWTRESVIEELATWLLTSPSVEASFIARHGRRGLVGNAKKIFGRFDAALNAANLRIAQKYPEGPPSRTTLPATRG